MSQTGPRFFLLIVVVKDTFAQINISLLISHLIDTLNHSLLISEKNLNHFKTFSYVGTDKTIYKIKNTAKNAVLSAYDKFLPCALHIEVYSCILLRNSSNLTFFHLLQDQQDLEFWSSHDHPIFPLLIQEIGPIVAFFVFLHSISLNISEEIPWKLTRKQTSTIPFDAVHCYCTTRRLFRGFVQIWLKKWVFWEISTDKSCQFFTIVHICKFNV